MYKKYLHHFATQEEHDTVYLGLGGEYDEPWVAAVKEDITDEEEEAEVTYNFPYQRVEYLESNGGPMINTDITGDNDYLTIDVTFMYQSFGKYGTIFSNYVSEPQNSWRLILRESDDNKYYANFNTKSGLASSVFGTPNEKGSKQHVIMSQWSVVGKQASINQTKGTTNNNVIHLFGTTNIGCRIYSFKVRNASTLLCDLFPVRIGQVGYMYDAVSGKLFGNIGTGNFVLGPDLY